MKNKGLYKKIGLLVFCLAITIFVLIMALSFNDFSAIADVLKTADIKYIFIAGGLTLLYAFLTPVTICMLMKSRKAKISTANSFVVGMTEHFFNGVTPFATGGQPFQVYAFNKVKVKPSESTGVLLMNFIIFMIVTNLFAVCSLFFYDKFTAGNESMHIVAIVGFTMNFLVLVFMIALATSKKVRWVISKILLLFCKIKFLKKFLEPKVPALNGYFENVQLAFKQLFKNKLVFFGCLIVKAITMAVYYAITFYILRAMNVNVGYQDLFFVISGTSFAVTMVAFLPTPGSSGGIEFAFTAIFMSLAGVGMTNAVAVSGMLIWRLLSYYFLMLVSLLFYIGFEIYYVKVFKKRCRNEELLAETNQNSETNENVVVEQNQNNENLQTEMSTCQNGGSNIDIDDSKLNEPVVPCDVQNE